MITVLIGYLFVLVPLNWLLFRVLGRVELAWAAAPVIAVVCTGLVVWLAQLDIGFARSDGDRRGRVAGELSTSPSDALYSFV